MLLVVVSPTALIAVDALSYLVAGLLLCSIRVPLGGGTALLTFGTVVAPNLAVAVPVVAAWPVATSLVIMNGITIRQRVTPEGLQSRVGATGRTRPQVKLAPLAARDRLGPL